jgi:signal peptidase II
MTPGGLLENQVTDDDTPPLHRGPRTLLTAVVLLLTGGCDQVAKKVAVAELKGTPRRSYLADMFRLEYAENPGAFLGLGGSLPGSWQFWILTIGVGALLLVMLGYLLWSRHLHIGPALGLAMMVGGGLSNWFDRLVNEGRVVDFMNLGIGSLRTGIFNVADVAIMAGAAVMVFGSSPRRRRQDPGDHASSPTPRPS